MSRDIERVRVVRYTDAAEPAEITDELAAEEPLEIRIAGRPLSVTMRTPGNDIELVAGYLLAEGLLNGAPLIRQEHPNVVNIAAGAITPPASRQSPIASACGICGKANIEAIHQCFAPLAEPERQMVSRKVVASLIPTLETAQAVFTHTGGLHAAGLFDSEGRLIVAREDIGRHNAVDKVIGHALLRHLTPLDRHILVVSGRASFEIVQKALGARIPVIAAVSAPSSLAVQFAEANGQTLIGFLRNNRWNVYTHAERIGA